MKTESNNWAAHLFPVVYLGISASLVFSAASMYLGVPFDVHLTLAFGALAYCIYQIDYSADISKNPREKVGRWLFFKRNPVFLYFAILLLAFCILSLVWAGKFTSCYGAVVILSLMYTLPLTPWPKRVKGAWFLQFLPLRNFTFLKNILVSSIWSASSFIIIIQVTHVKAPDTIALIFVIGACAIWNLTNNIASDMHDVVGDAHEGSLTIPVVFGTQWTKRFLMVLNLSATLAVVSACSLGWLAPAFGVIYAIITAYTIGVLLPFHVFDRRVSDSTYAVLADSYLVIQFLGIAAYCYIRQNPLLLAGG